MQYFQTLFCRFLLIIALLGNATGIPKEALLSSYYVVGRLADIEDFPFIASVRINGVHQCAASIVHENWVLTSAQCYQNISEDHYTVTSSIQQLKLATGNEHQVAKIVLSKDAKLALIKIVDVFTENPALLPANRLGNYEMGIIVGWGFTAHPGTTPKDLRRLYLRIMDDFSCQAAYHDYRADGSMICTMPEGKMRGICTGDVGSPLTANGKVYGIASWRQNCLDGKPETFHSIASHLLWINNVIYNNLS